MPPPNITEMDRQLARLRAQHNNPNADAEVKDRLQKVRAKRERERARGAEWAAKKAKIDPASEKDDSVEALEGKVLADRILKPSKRRFTLNLKNIRDRINNTASEINAGITEANITAKKKKRIGFIPVPGTGLSARKAEKIRLRSAWAGNEKVLKDVQKEIERMKKKAFTLNSILGYFRPDDLIFRIEEDQEEEIEKKIEEDQEEEIEKKIEKTPEGGWSGTKDFLISYLTLLLLVEKISGDPENAPPQSAEARESIKALWEKDSKKGSSKSPLQVRNSTLEDLLKEAKKEMAKIQDLTQDLWEHIKEEAVAAAYSTPNEKSWEERIQEQQKMKTLGPSVAMTRKRLATPPTASPRRQDPRADGRFSVTGRSTNEVIALRRARLRARGGGGCRRTKRKKRRTKRKKRRTKRKKRRTKRRKRRRRRRTRRRR